MESGENLRQKKSVSGESYEALTVKEYEETMITKQSKNGSLPNQ